MLCVNVDREDLEIHAARMKAAADQTRDLMGRHRAIAEGIVNNRMNHQDVRHAHWKGLAPFPCSTEGFYPMLAGRVRANVEV